MSRPATPAYTVPTWATTANYPGGGNPWNGQPSKVTFPDPATGFVPDQGAAAEYFNKLFNDAFTADAAAKTAVSAITDYAGQLLASFPFAPSPPGGTFQGSGVTYNQAGRAWMCFGTAGPGVSIRRSTDGGITWGSNEYTDAARNIVDGVCRPQSDLFTAITSTGHILEGNTAGYTLSGIQPFGATPTAMRIYATPSGNFVALGHVSGTIAAYTSANNALAVWTTRTPAIGSGALGVGLLRAAIRPSDERIVCVNAAGSNQVTVQTSTDQGFTWTAQATLNLATVTGLASPANTSIDLKWDAGGNRFVLAVSKNGGAGASNADIYASTDGGVSWTLLKSFVSNAVYGIAAAGSMLIVLYGIASVYSRIAYSVDNGATWRDTMNLGTTAPLGLIYGGAEAGQVMAFSTTFVRPSIRAGLFGLVSVL